MRCWHVGVTVTDVDICDLTFTKRFYVLMRPVTEIWPRPPRGRPLVSHVLWNHGACPPSHSSPATPNPRLPPPPPRPPSLWVPPLPVSLSNGISLFRLNSGCCSVSWWCLHGQFVPLIPRNGPPLPGPAEGQWGQHCQPGLRNGRQLHCLQHSQQ